MGTLFRKKKVKEKETTSPSYNKQEKKEGAIGMLVKDYISKGGAHIKIYDDFIDDSPENRERIYNNLSRIATGILLRQYDEAMEKQKGMTGIEESNLMLFF